MTKEYFLNQVTDEVRKLRPYPEFEVNCDTFRKNNNTIRHGIIIRGRGDKISPTIYLDQLYENYLRKKCTISEIANEVVDTFEKVRAHALEYAKISIEYENCKDNIVFFLVSKEKNEELLKEVPYFPFLDFAITFQVVLSVKEHGIEALRINNELIEKWGVTASDLFQCASENSPRLFPPEICSLTELLLGILDDEEDELSKELKDMTPLLIVTNTAGVNGASVLLYPDVIHKLALDLDTNLYILPSSIHEVLVMPDTGEDSLAKLSDMVKHINTDHVSPDEVLSDKAYYYDRKEKRFIM